MKIEVKGMKCERFFRLQWGKQDMTPKRNSLPLTIYPVYNAAAIISKIARIK